MISLQISEHDEEYPWSNNALLLEKLINLTNKNSKDDEAGGGGSTLSGRKQQQ